ncbi:hypothetical protein V6N13_047952 [Hibiscus sabdariffa]
MCPGRADPSLQQANLHIPSSGPGHEELIDQITQNDRPRAPPALESDNQRHSSCEDPKMHLRNDKECPVCKEEFDMCRSKGVAS